MHPHSGGSIARNVCYCILTFGFIILCFSKLMRLAQSSKENGSERSGAVQVHYRKNESHQEGYMTHFYILTVLVFCRYAQLTRI